MVRNHDAAQITFPGKGLILAVHFRGLLLPTTAAAAAMTRYWVTAAAAFEKRSLPVLPSHSRNPWFPRSFWPSAAVAAGVSPSSLLTKPKVAARERGKRRDGLLWYMHSKYYSSVLSTVQVDVNYNNLPPGTTELLHTDLTHTNIK